MALRLLPAMCFHWSADRNTEEDCSLGGLCAFSGSMEYLLCAGLVLGIGIISGSVGYTSVLTTDIFV